MTNEQNKEDLSFPHLSFFILASGSPRRRELIQLLGLPFQVEKAAVVETVCDGESPQEVSLRLAQAKARAVAAQAPDALVLGCDTVVAFEGELLGKPTGPEEAREMLARLRNRDHAVYTGIAVVGGQKEAVEVVETTVRMRDYTDAELAAYVASGDPLDKAGAYAIQNAAFDPVQSWDGCYANVVGLPLCHIERMLRGWSIFPSVDLPSACQVYTRQDCTVYPSILDTDYR